MHCSATPRSTSCSCRRSSPLARARARSRAAMRGWAELERGWARRHTSDPGELRRCVGCRTRGRRHADAQLEVLARGCRELGGLLPERQRDLGDAGGERQTIELQLDPHAAALCEMTRVGRDPVGEVDHRVRARCRERASLGQTGLRTAGSAAPAPAVRSHGRRARQGPRRRRRACQSRRRDRQHARRRGRRAPRRRRPSRRPSPRASAPARA